MAAFAGVNQLVREEKLDRALEEAGKLVEMYPDRSKIHADLGGILYKMGQYDSAVNTKASKLVTCRCFMLVCLDISIYRYIYIALTALMQSFRYVERFFAACQGCLQLYAKQVAIKQSHAPATFGQKMHI